MATERSEGNVPWPIAVSILIRPLPDEFSLQRSLRSRGPAGPRFSQQQSRADSPPGAEEGSWQMPASIQFFATSEDFANIFKFLNESPKWSFLTCVGVRTWQAAKREERIENRGYLLWCVSSGRLPLRSNTKGLEYEWIDPSESFRIRSRGQSSWKLHEVPDFGPGFPGIFELRVNIAQPGDDIMHQSSFGGVLDYFIQEYIEIGYEPTTTTKNAWSQAKAWFRKQSEVVPSLARTGRNTSEIFRIFPGAKELYDEGARAGDIPRADPRWF